MLNPGSLVGSLRIAFTLPKLTPPPTTEFNNAPTTATSGGAVNTYTGAFSYTYAHTDLSIAGRGPSPAFVRSYNSNDTWVSPLGIGWAHSYHLRVANANDASRPNDLTLVGAQGRSDRYRWNADGSYTSPAGVATKLVKNRDGSYTATLKDQTTWSFSASGLLLRIADRYGNQAVLSYSGGRLVSVSDPAGRGSLSFAYNATGERLASISDWQSPSPRVVSFQYDASNRLWKVTDREGQVTEYGYDASNRLTSIKDARGNVGVTNTYDASGLRFVLLKWAASPRKEARPRALTT